MYKPASYAFIFSYFSNVEIDQTFIISQIYAAVDDVVPSVRSAACRAIGVMTCFPEICQRYFDISLGW